MNAQSICDPRYYSTMTQACVEGGKYWAACEISNYVESSMVFFSCTSSWNSKLMQIMLAWNPSWNAVCSYLQASSSAGSLYVNSVKRVEEQIELVLRTGRKAAFVTYATAMSFNTTGKCLAKLWNVIQAGKLEIISTVMTNSEYRKKPLCLQVVWKGDITIGLKAAWKRWLALEYMNCGLDGIVSNFQWGIFHGTTRRSWRVHLMDHQGTQYRSKTLFFRGYFGSYILVYFVLHGWLLWLFFLLN